MNSWTKTTLLAVLFTSPLALAEKITFRVPEYVSYKNVYANSDGTLSFTGPTISFDGQSRYLVGDSSAQAYCSSLGNFVASSSTPVNSGKEEIVYDHSNRRLSKYSYHLDTIRCRKIRIEIPENPQSNVNTGKLISLEKPQPVIFSAYYSNYGGMKSYVNPRMYIDGVPKFLPPSSAEYVCNLLGKSGLNYQYSSQQAHIQDPESARTYTGIYMTVLRCQEDVSNSTSTEQTKVPSSFTKKIENFGGITTYINPKIKFDGTDQAIRGATEDGQTFCQGFNKSWVNGEYQTVSDGTYAYSPDYRAVVLVSSVWSLIRCE